MKVAYCLVVGTTQIIKNNNNNKTVVSLVRCNVCIYRCKTGKGVMQFLFLYHEILKPFFPINFFYIFFL